jgi:hypothetical protein
MEAFPSPFSSAALRSQYRRKGMNAVKLRQY